MELETRWPPRSPHEALLSSPSGRRRVRQYQDRTSPSPTTSKKVPIVYHARRGRIEHEEGSDDEDEETLQLRLEALEARLKLKKLQQKKLRTTITNSNNNGSKATPRSHVTSIIDGMTENRQNASSTIPESLAAIQVSVSPLRKRVETKGARSPGRVLLGIDKGLTGKNVSLRRYTCAQPRDTNNDHFATTLRHGSISSIAPLEVQRPKPKTFSERIVETRRREKEDSERQIRLRRQRSTGFGVEQRDLVAFRNYAASTATNQKRELDSNAIKGISFSRDEVVKSLNKTNEGPPYRTHTISVGHNTHRRGCSPSNRPVLLKAPFETFTEAKDTPNLTRTRSGTSPTQSPKPKSPITEEPSLFEPFSSTHLSKRLLPHPFVSKTLGQKHVSLIPSLLATIKSPGYILPETLEDDFVVFGIIASKSSPLSHKQTIKKSPEAFTSLQEATESEVNAKGKYIVFTLTDLKWSLEFYIFSTAYTRFWKLTPGTLVAILNPSIMPPPPEKIHTGRFSLTLNSGEDSILEIGTSRDLGWCKSIKKDGKQCSSWINKKHTEYCEYHIDRVVESTRRGRMEVNGMSAPYAPGGKKGGRTGYWGPGKKNQKEEDGLIKEGPQWDRSTRSTYFIGPSLGRSAASLIDGDGGGPMERGGTTEERVRKRLAERAREREIARRLGEAGNGIGREYLRLGSSNDTTGFSSGSVVAGQKSRAGKESSGNASALGLLGNKATDVHLSPIRNKKRKGDEAGGDGDRIIKKTRFVTQRGVREAGRESLSVTPAHGEGEDDDELDIV